MSALEHRCTNRWFPSRAMSGIHPVSRARRLEATSRCLSSLRSRPPTHSWAQPRGGRISLLATGIHARIAARRRLLWKRERRSLRLGRRRTHVDEPVYPLRSRDHGRGERSRPDRGSRSPSFQGTAIRARGVGTAFDRSAVRIETTVVHHTWRGQIGGHPDAALHDAAVPVSRSSAQSRCALRMLLPAQLTRPIWTPCRLGV